MVPWWADPTGIWTWLLDVTLNGIADPDAERFRFGACRAPMLKSPAALPVMMLPATGSTPMLATVIDPPV